MVAAEVWPRMLIGADRTFAVPAILAVHTAVWLSDTSTVLNLHSVVSVLVPPAYASVLGAVTVNCLGASVYSA
jgi:hypothetical protein